MTAPMRKGHVTKEFVLQYQHPVLTDASLAFKLFKVPDGRVMRINRVEYINVTGLTEDAANFFDIQVTKGDTPAEIANWSTELTVGDGSIPADDFIELPMTDATGDEQVVVGGAAAGADEVTLNFGENGTTTLPADGIITLHCEWTK